MSKYERATRVDGHIIDNYSPTNEQCNMFNHTQPFSNLMTYLINATFYFQIFHQKDIDF